MVLESCAHGHQNLHPHVLPFLGQRKQDLPIRNSLYIASRQRCRIGIDLPEHISVYPGISDIRNAYTIGRKMLRYSLALSFVCSCEYHYRLGHSLLTDAYLDLHATT